MPARDEFTPATKRRLAQRAGYLCSHPECRRPTIGADASGDGTINLGEAAHITAAAQGGPRYDPFLSSEERRSQANGIWMCALHAKEVDSDEKEFTVERLREWKNKAEAGAFDALTTGKLVLPQGILAVDAEVLERLGLKDTDIGRLTERLKVAARADIDAFKALPGWPVHAVTLNLQTAGSGAPAFDITACVSAIEASREITIVAPPGTGKSTTCVQLVEALLGRDDMVAALILLNEWSAQSHGLLESLTHRAPHRGTREQDLQALAAHGRLALVLDAWNELDPASRRRATAEIGRLQRETPLLQLIVSTRRQALDVPLTGPKVEIQPLSDVQQLEIARAIGGDAGEKLLDQVWRQAGLRDLISIPLYLTALLQAPHGAMPDTKEEVLRLFIEANEKSPKNATALRDGFYDLHGEVLRGLAVEATVAANTAISEARSRSIVAGVEGGLKVAGQITEQPQPAAVLELLVNHHTLTWISGSGGVSFQHEQIQEWYASLEVEQLMREAAAGNPGARARLRTDVLNWPAWDEAILFACERVSRADNAGAAVVAAAILDALAIDPMLAAEMISRSTDAVWARVGSTVQALVRRWHAPGRVDRALRFMILSSRPEFLDQVWPLITDEDDQVSLAALRAAGRHFRPSLLGSDAAMRIAALPPNIRKNVLHEIAFNSGVDGLDLAAYVAKNDPDPEVKAMVADAFAFRRADRHLVEVLRGADEMTFNLVARKGLIDDVTDEQVKAGLDAARERQRKSGISTYDRLSTIIYARDDEDYSCELAEIVAEMEIDKRQDAGVGLLYEARTRYSRAVADGLLQRVRAGRTLFYGADDILAVGGFSLEDDELVGIALADSGRHDDRAEAAATVLGPQAVGCMIQALLAVKKRIRDANGRYDQAAGDRYHDLLTRIAHTPGASLVAAIRARSAQAGNEEMADLAELISRHPNGENDRGRPFDADALAAIATLAEEWGNRLLASAVATRAQLAYIATLASKSPSACLLPLLKRLLDEDLRQWRAFQEQARASHYRQGTASNEARVSWTLQYQRAFQAISGPETVALMRDYLPDEDFGQSAALVLAGQWRAANEPSDDKSFRSGVDFSRVEERRAARAADPAATSAEAEAIFSVIETLIADKAAENQKKHAVALGVVAARLPHGERGATIQKLLALAPRRSRAALLQNLIFSGKTIDVEMVRNGIAEMLEAAKTQSWILSQDGYELKEWLRLLPFTTRPADALDIVRGLPDQQCNPTFMEEMITAFGVAPADDSENVLFQLAEDDARLYENRAWREAVVRRGTLPAARRFVDLAANGAFHGKGVDGWQIARQLAALIAEHPGLRAHVYNLLKDGPTSPGLELLAQAVAENPDAEGLLLLIKIEIEHKRSFASWRTIENIVTEHVPAENWKGAYNVVPVPAAELRRTLLSMTTDGGPADAAARCLNQIDKIRDRYGAPESDPRHPDLASSQSWPIVTSDPDATETA